MKKIIPISAIFLLLFSVGCKTNLDEVFNRLDDHEVRLKAIEKKIKSANDEITKLSQLINAQSDNISIVSYKQLENKLGYELLMSDGSKITLKNGEDGNSSVINIKKHSDGLLYWTLNNEFMKDADGNMIKAEGTKGISPKLRVNTANQWEMSTDEGKTWQAVLGADGNPVPATGPQGEPGGNATVELEISETDDAVIIKYKGATYVLSKSVNKPSRPKLPIEYVAEYNVNITGDNFTGDHTNKTLGLFNWYEAAGEKNETYNPSGKNIFEASAFKGKYHFPTHKEFRGIIPDEAIDWAPGSNNISDANEEITVAGVTANYKADYNLRKGRGRCYALRFKGNGDLYRCAYRYLYTNNKSDTDSKLKKMMTVTVRYLGKENMDITLDKISEESFWTQSDVEYITRLFPATGYSNYNTPEEVYRRGEQGFHWTATEQFGKWKEKYAISMNFYENHFDVTTNAFNKKRDRYAIRPFSNK